MTATRTLPVPIEHRELTVTVEGTAVGREHQLLAATVVKAANRISWVRLVYLDGSASASNFPLSGSDLMIPGKKVEVSAGAANDAARLFTGVVVRTSVKIREHTAPQLVVECRHAAVRMAVGRKNAYFLDQTDSDVMKELVSGAGLTPDVAATSPAHKQLVQYRASDWDFMLARASANGLLAFTNGDGVVVTRPDVAAAPVCSFQFGATILELDAEIDARSQFKACTGITWDPADQAVLKADADDPGISGPGNLSSDDLAEVAGLDGLELRRSGLTEEETKLWADAELLRTRLSRVSGRIKCEGLGTVNPGDRATLAGIGSRFSGDVYVVGVRHDFDQVQGWKTHVQFGAPAERPTHEGISGSSDELVPAVRGLQLAVVTGNEDPGGEHRVRVRVPVLSPDSDGTWARVASLDAGDDRGWFIRPEIGDEVVVGFVEDDPRAPVILGMLPSSAKPAPITGSDANDQKVFKTRSGMQLFFDDEKKVMRFETPAGTQIVLDEDQQLLALKDESGNKLEMSPDGITIESARALSLKSGTEMKLDGGTSFDATASTELKLAGSMGAELSSSTTARLKGSLVQIN